MTKAIARIPKRVLLCAIGYTVTVRENMVLFAAERGVAGCYKRLAFERRCGCWYVEIASNDGAAMTEHVLEAQKMIDRWFGGNHDCPRGEYVP